MLAVDHLTKTFAGPAGVVRALTDFSLSLGAGEFVSVRGPSGCGKTTLLLAAGGLLRPDSGKVTIDEQDVYALSQEERAELRASKIGFVFQQFHLVPYLSVLENVMTPALARPLPDAEQRARELLTKFGLASRLDHIPSKLSTGERQRTALARALLQHPKLLLADEPTGNLDDQNGQVVLGHFADFARDGGAVLLVTHDPRSADFAHRTVLLETAALAASTTGENV